MRLQWKKDPDKSVRVVEPLAHALIGEGQFEGELARFGHGLQRSYLLALLQELARSDDNAGSKLILACEEPELYQHPPQARHLANVLDTLSKENAQVIVSTHDPLFVSGQGFEDVRMIRKDPTQGCSRLSHTSFQRISEDITNASGKPLTKPEGRCAKIHQALQPALNEMFFTHRLVLVEGPEDIAYLLSYLNFLDKADEFRRLGVHIVAVNGKSQLLEPLVVARHLKIPTYVVFDADADKPDKSGSQNKHRQDNNSLLSFLGSSEIDPFPNDTCSGPGFTMWHSDIGAIVEADIGTSEWTKFRDMADHLYGHASALRKNSLHIGASLAFAWDQGKRSERLVDVCQSLLDPNSYLS